MPFFANLLRSIQNHKRAPVSAASGDQQASANGPRSEGTLQGIWIKRMHRGPMDAVDSALLLARRGIEGNANLGGRRQVTIIEQEVWDDLMQRIGGTLPPASRRANLMVQGIRLENSRKHVLCIGPCRIRIFGETKPCKRMDELLPGLRKAMKEHWAGGAFGEVLEGGSITVGDSVWWDNE